MKKIVAINFNPRPVWNTATLVREAAKGADAQGAEITMIDLYKLEKFTCCVSCFGCKLPNEDFPASGRLLLDSSADHYLTIEDAVTVAEILLEKITKEKFL